MDGKGGKQEYAILRSRSDDYLGGKMKELVRAIKRAGKRKSLVWLRDGEFEYIQMGLISVKTERLQAEELGALVSFFGEIPEYGVTISQHRESTDKEKKAKQLILSTTIEEIFASQRAMTSLINTNVLIEDMGYLVPIIIQSVVQVENRAAGIAENNFDILFQQTFHDNLRAG